MDPVGTVVFALVLLFVFFRQLLRALKAHYLPSEETENDLE